MSTNPSAQWRRRGGWALALAAAALILACQVGPRPTPTISPTATRQAPDLQTPTGTATPAARVTATATSVPPTATASPSPTVEPTATATRRTTHTPTPFKPPTATPSPTPPLPDDGPLPALWTEIDLSLPRGGVFYPLDLTLEEEGERAYVLGRCVPEPRYEGAPIPGCLATIDLASGQVLRTTELPVGYDARLTLAGGVAYLHPMWGGDLHVLDAGALALGAMPAEKTLEDVRAVAYDGVDTTYAVTLDQLVRLSPDTLSVPIEVGYDDTPLALAASPRHVFLLGYSTLQVFTPELQRLGAFDVREQAPRAMVLDAAQDLAYIGAGTGLWAFDANEVRLYPLPARDETGEPVRSIEWLRLHPKGGRLWARTREPDDWYGGVSIIEIEAAGDEYGDRISKEAQSEQ